MEVVSICIVGAGVMGTGIAQVAAQAGIPVVLVDVGEEALERSRRRLARSLQESVDRGKLSAEEAAAAASRVSWGSGYAALGTASWAMEAIFEDLDAKREALRRMAERVPAGVPVSTNTSTFLVRDLAREFGRPTHFMGLHFSNPAPAMKLVEVIPGPETLPEVTAAGIALCERMGKTPILSPDIPGFVINRAFGALVASALQIWDAGGEPAAIDQAIELGLGHKMGPLKTADLVGLDIMLALLQSLQRQTGDARFAPSERLAELVRSGKLGRKSGSGIYEYEG